MTRDTIQQLMIDAQALGDVENAEVWQDILDRMDAQELMEWKE